MIFSKFSRKIWKSFKTRLNNFFKNGNITGIRFLSDEMGVLTKIFWTISIILSFWIMLKFLKLTSERFNSNIISIGIDSSYLNWNSTYPSVSLCLSKGRSSRKIINYVQRFNISYPGTETSYIRNIHSFMFANPNQMNVIIEECKNLNETCGIDINQLKSELLPNSCNDILIDVQLNGKIYKNCGEIFKFHKTEMGHCFIANSIIDFDYDTKNLPLKFNRATTDRSLQFFFKKSSFWSYLLFVHSPEDLPTFNLMTMQLSADSLHFYYAIEEIINQPDVINEKITNRGCRFPNEKLNGSVYHYSFSTCMSDLRIKTELEYCNCTLSTAPEKYYDSYCTVHDMDCLSTVDINKIVKDLHYESEITSCLPSCLEQTIKSIGENDILDDLPNNVGKVIIEIIDLPTIRYIRYVSVTRLDLVVTIGGIVSLFFGASVLNIVEFIYIWFIRKI